MKDGSIFATLIILVITAMLFGVIICSSFGVSATTEIHNVTHVGLNSDAHSSCDYTIVIETGEVLSSEHMLNVGSCYDMKLVSNWFVENRYIDRVIEI